MSRRDKPASPLRPTVIGSVAAVPRAKPAPAAATAKPAAAVPAAAVPAPAAPVPPVAAKSATKMPGAEPKRIAPDPALLARLAPEASEAVVAAAALILARVIPAHLDDRTTLFWGQDLQEAHRKLLDARIALQKSALLQEVPLHLSRLRALLMRMDAETLATKGGLMAASLRGLSRMIDTPGELAQARAEIEQLLRLLTKGAEGLAGLKTQLTLNGAALAELGDRVEAMALAAAGLAESAETRFVRALRERRDSLRVTAIHIRQGQMLHEAEAEMPGRLVLAIQNLALVALPAWMQNLALFEAKLASGRPPSLTEARDLTFRLHELIPLFPRTE